MISPAYHITSEDMSTTEDIIAMVQPETESQTDSEYFLYFKFRAKERKN